MRILRTLSFTLGVLMALFASVQFNDPDGIQWIVVYSVPALFAFIASFKAEAYRSPILRKALLSCLLLSVAGTMYFWPQSQNWWTQEIWWELETAREGIGMMITLVVLAVVYWVQHRLQSRR